MDIKTMQYTFSGHILGFGDKKREERLEKIRELMKREDLSCLLLLNKGVDGLCQWITALPAPDIPSHKSGGYLIRPEGAVIELGSDVVMDEAYYESRRELDEMPVPTLPIRNLEFRPGLDVKDLSFAGNHRLGVVHLKQMKKNQRDYLRQNIPELELVDMTLQVLELISIKDADEIQAMRECANIHDRLFAMLGFVIRPERLEKEIVTELRYHSYSCGGAGQDNTRMTLIDLTSAPDGGSKEEEPIRYPGRRLRPGDRVNITLRAEEYNDYYAGLGRCYVLGEASEETKKNWATAVEAQQKAAEALKPGAILSQAAEVANEYLRSAGVPEDDSAFLYGIGYTVGEVPVLYGTGSQIPLQEGMTIVVAPKVSKPGQDSFCCMDTYLITSEGCERITKTPQELIELKMD